MRMVIAFNARGLDGEIYDYDTKDYVRMVSEFDLYTANSPEERMVVLNTIGREMVRNKIGDPQFQSLLGLNPDDDVPEPLFTKEQAQDDEYVSLKMRLWEQQRGNADNFTHVREWMEGQVQLNEEMIGRIWSYGVEHGYFFEYELKDLND